MGFIIGIFKFIIKLILLLLVLIAFILLVPNLPPYTKFTSIKIEPTQQRSGSLAPNDVLNQPKHLYKDKLLGPEYFQVWNDEVYTSLATGEIVKLSRGGHVTFVAQIGEPCKGLTQEHICGRPLGFVIDEKNKNLFLADAYYGIWKVNLQNNKKQLLVSPNVAIDGKFPKLFNSIALDSNGEIYWTHSSSEYHLKDGVFAVLSDPSGRLMYYNAAKNESKVLLDDLWFANGLAISPDNQFVIVAETSRYRLTKYYINGPRKGKSEVFVSGLPGLPDTVRPLPDGSGVLVSLYTVFDDENPFITKSMSEAPLARKLLARLFRLVEIPFEFLQTHFNNHVFETIVYYIGNFCTAEAFSTGMSGLVQIDWNGNIVASYYNTDGSLLHISDAIVFNNQLLTACPHNQDFVGALPVPPLLKGAFAKQNKAKAEVKTEQQYEPEVNEPKEVPKNAKPAEKVQPARAAEPVENKQNVKQQEAKQNTATKEPEVKPKVSKDAVTKPKAKEAAPKPKVEESKAKVQTKEEAPKPTEKPKVVQKEPDVKPKVETKPVVKESKNADENKPKEANVKQPTVKQTAGKVEKQPEKAQVKADKTNEQAKAVPKKTDEAKASEPKSQPKNKKVKEEPQKVIPIEEEIPSDTMKPSKEKLKVIKKNGPQEIPNPN